MEHGFLPITKSVPKEMLPIINKPAIEYIVDEAVLSGIREFYTIVSDSKQAIKDYFNKSDNINLCNFNYVQQNKQLGLGHAVLMAKDCVQDDFLQ